VNENSALRKISIWAYNGQDKRDWTRLQKGAIYDLYSSPSSIRVIKSRIIRWEGHVARIRERESGEVRTGFWWGILRETNHFEDLGEDGMTILKRILRRTTKCGEIDLLRNY
jgi:hypothetical protein